MMRSNAVDAGTTAPSERPVIRFADRDLLRRSRCSLARIPVEIRSLRVALASGALFLVTIGVGLAQSSSSSGNSGASSSQTSQGPASYGGSTTNDNATPLPTRTQAPQAMQTVAPNGLLVSGTLRAYDFDRQNGPQNASNTNESSINFGAFLHGDYRLSDTPLHLGVSYFGAYPFGQNGGDSYIELHNHNADNTLPGFPMSTVPEAYARYNDKYFSFTVGDQVINYAWAPASDTRLKPSAFQGAEFNWNIGPSITVGLSRMIAFESRTQSTFTRNTLITASDAGATTNPTQDTAGFLREYIDYKAGGLTARVENYDFYDIANLVFGDMKYSFAPRSELMPFIAAQYVSEANTGRAVLGAIANNTIGVQFGVNPVKSVAFSFGMDSAPTLYRDVAASTAAIASQYFEPSGGTPFIAARAPGLYRVAYGGIASPYTDTYTSDPLFTTSISQGMIERRSGGTSFKATLQYKSATKQLVITGSEAYYDYSDELGVNNTYELDGDVIYFFNHVGAGPYKGLSFRERLADRTQPTIPYNFKYIRTQLQYDF